jgi:hypothetical protein
MLKLSVGHSQWRSMQSAQSALLTRDSGTAVLASASVRQRQVHDLKPPTAQRCKLLIHAPQIHREQRSLFAARTRPDLHRIV